MKFLPFNKRQEQKQTFQRYSSSTQILRLSYCQNSGEDKKIELYISIIVYPIIHIWINNKIVKAI